MLTGVLKPRMNLVVEKSNFDFNYIDCDFNNKKICKKEETDTFAITAYNMAIEMLPHTTTGSDYIQYISNEFILSVKANPNYGLPYGTSLRALFDLIVNEIKCTKSPVLRLGKIYLNFRRIYRSPQFSDMRLNDQCFYDQMLRLLSSKILFTNQCRNEKNQLEFWWNPLKERRKNVSASSTVVVTKELFTGLSRI